MRTIGNLKRQILNSGIGVIILLLTGCAQTIQYPHFPDQAKKVEDPAKARIYLMRPGKMLFGGDPLIFYGNDWEATGPVFDPTIFGNYSTAHSRQLGELGPGGYICWETPPHPLRMEGVEGHTNSIFTIHLEAGNVYYLRASSRPGLTRLKSAVELVPEKQGLALLKGCKPPNGYRK
jgi:hypothetical protein